MRSIRDLLRFSVKDIQKLGNDLADCHDRNQDIRVMIVHESKNSQDVFAPQRWRDATGFWLAGVHLAIKASAIKPTETLGFPTYKDLLRAVPPKHDENVWAQANRLMEFLTRAEQHLESTIDDIGNISSIGFHDLPRNGYSVP